MYKHVKSIAFVVMMVVMLVTFSVPAMAAEQPANVDTTLTLEQKVENEDGVARLADPVGEFHYTGRLASGKVLGTVNISENAKIVRWTVGRDNANANVRFRITNNDTGESRAFTTTANNTLDGIDYTTALSKGNWEVKVDWNNNNWLYDVDLYFYVR